MTIYFASLRSSKTKEMPTLLLRLNLPSQRFRIDNRS